MTENKRFIYIEHKGADYILDNPNWDLDYIEMLGDTLEPKEIVDLLNNLNEKMEYDERVQNEALGLIRNQRKTIERLNEENEQLKQSFINLIDKKIEEFKNGDYGDLPHNTIHMFLDLKEELKMV